MPVKVRCPSCDKLLNAPDAARGKAIRCPGCETKIPVPKDEGGESASSAGRGAVKTATKKKAAAGMASGEFLANLDLSKAIDSSANMCPKCGADIPEEATECPKCGVDPTTGQLSDAAKKRQSRRGPDPALFYSKVWKDAWTFTRANMRVVIRTMMYILLTYSLVGGCLFMSWWSTRLPPKMFWFSLAMVATQIVPGWLWFLTLETIRVSVARKSDITDRNFDIFLSISLGLQALVWSALFSTLPGSMIMYPLCMVHMAMPVTKKAWFWATMLPVLFRNLGPTLYYWVVAFVVSLPGTVALGGAAVLGAGTVVQFVQGMQSQQKPGVVAWLLVSLLVVVGILGVFVYSFSMIYMMRVNGLLAYYFKDTLDLTVQVAEKQYVRKEIKLDAFGNPVRSSGQKAMGIIVPIIVLMVIGAVGYFIYMQLFAKPGG